MQVEDRPLDALVPDPANPRTHDERNLGSIMESLRQHGQVEPLVVQASTGMVIAGNGRREAMLRLGWTSAAVAVVDVTNEQARKLSITLNRTAELAGWDEQVLGEHLRALQALDDGWSASDMGWSDAELAALAVSFTEPPDATEPAVEPDPPVAPVAPVASTTEEPPPAPAPPTDDDEPIKLPAADQKRLELYLSDTQRTEFMRGVNALARRWGTDNITDTVLMAVQKLASAR